MAANGALGPVYRPTRGGSTLAFLEPVYRPTPKLCGNLLAAVGQSNPLRWGRPVNGLPPG